jgi:hypothetical protein
LLVTSRLAIASSSSYSITSSAREQRGRYIDAKLRRWAPTRLYEQWLPSNIEIRAMTEGEGRSYFAAH